MVDPRHFGDAQANAQTIRGAVIEHRPPGDTYECSEVLGFRGIASSDNYPDDVKHTRIPVVYV